MASFTYAYSQPGAYHFCQDSVLAPKLIANDVLAAEELADRQGAQPLRALDAYAGCGVMAFELMHALNLRGRLDSIAQFDFIEVQPEFERHFRENVRITSAGIPFSWKAENASILQTKLYQDRYDLIIANPPYFQRGEGTLSANEMNNRARFFLDDSIESMLKGFRNALAPQGRAYFLMKSGKEHGRDAFASARLAFHDCQVGRLASVRGTDLIRCLR